MKRNYDYSLYKELGGDPDRLPQVETYKDFNGKIKYQIFLYADALNWPEFRRLALIAAQAHFIQRDPINEGQYIERDAPPIAGSPYYKLEPEGDSYNLWVNIQCPNEAEYVAVKAVAESKIREIQRAKYRFGPMWHTQVNADLMESRHAGSGADEAVNSLLTAFNIATY